MPEHIGIFCGKEFNVGAVGIREGVEGQAVGRAREELIDTGHDAHENGVPPLEQLCIGEVDVQRIAQPGKKGCVADLALFMASIEFVTSKTRSEMRYLASGVTGPTTKRSVEIEVEHDATEIK
jgi:hypothetical protein